MDRLHRCTCFTKPVTKPYSRNSDFRGHAYKRALVYCNICFERTVFALTSSLITCLNFYYQLCCWTQVGLFGSWV